jgi:dTMP kinase
MFITLEGIEGSGKSTQVKLLADRLKKTGHDVVVTREPGGTPIADQIRKILLDANNKNLEPFAELLLYYAAREQHIKEVITPALTAGKIVLCDRFIDASVAYQGYARGLDLKFISQLNTQVLGSTKIDLTILFDLPVAVGLSRARGRAATLAKELREERFENERREFHERVRQGYLSIAKQEPKRVVVVDGALGVEALAEKVWEVVKKKL